MAEGGENFLPVSKLYTSLSLSLSLMITRQVTYLFYIN